ncbi:hypothetical protein ACRRTK_000059 [Alexandromys fortis]
MVLADLLAKESPFVISRKPVLFLSTLLWLTTPPLKLTLQPLWIKPAFSVVAFEPETDSVCSIFVLEARELAVIMGCKVAGVCQIIDITSIKTNSQRPKHSGPLTVLTPKISVNPFRKYSLRCQMGGVDYSFKTIGSMRGVREALQATRKDRGQVWGSGQRVSVVVGLAASGEEIITPPFHLVTGHTSPLENRGVESFSKLVSEYMTKNIEIEFVPGHEFLDQINKFFHLMCQGKSTGTLLKMLS